MNSSYKVLQVTASDVTVKNLLLPLIDRLGAESYRVEIVCSDGEHARTLRERGYNIHSVAIERCVNPLSNLRSLWRLYRLMKKRRYDIVHVHTPVAAALGRLAAWLAGIPVIIYTAHGFYFHERMPARARRAVVGAERFLGRFTHLIFTQSREDAASAVSEKICPADKVVCIGNGVNTGLFTGGPNGVRADLGLASDDKVVGFVGRMVAEKGVLELLTAMEEVGRRIPRARLVLVGDTLESERDHKTKHVIREMLACDGLASRVVSTGFREDIPELMQAIDVFTLPSYREGMPRSIIEAMAAGKPVVATNIRGCREEVVPGATGLLVPVGDAAALADAIIGILADEELARRMGEEAKRRAAGLFDERLVLDRQMKAYEKIAAERLSLKGSLERKGIQRLIKRAADILISSMCLLFLALPFAAVAALVKLDSRGPVFFRQERSGRDGRIFKIWKFRTMIVDAVNHGLGVTVAAEDARITRAGKLLRNLGLDELPQLINVLAGEMSLVGPRPTLPYQVELYGSFERQRLLASPGITSLAVVSGRNALSWDERIALDVEYLRRWSLRLDAGIIARTFWSVLVTRRGIYGEGGVNDEFVRGHASR